MTNKKIRKQLREVKKQIKENQLSLNEMSNLFGLRNELEFKQDKKQNINFTLKGYDKYYYASHCRQFTKNLKKYGYGNIKKEDILKNGVSFNNYSINNGYSQYNSDIKRFNSKLEMLGFVIGYNNAISNQLNK
jgi:hypothetical protein